MKFRPFTKESIEREKKKEMRAQKIEEEKQKKEEKKERPKMKNITINLPDAYDASIWKLIDMKIVPSRSEAIRMALREFLRNEISFYNKLNNGGFPSVSKGENS